MIAYDKVCARARAPAETIINNYYPSECLLFIASRVLFPSSGFPRLGGFVSCETSSLYLR